MEQPTSEIAVGAVLGDTYEVIGLLGRGGMGAVWSARHLRLRGKRVAVKVLHGGAASDREAYARFRREAEVASQIGHPNIVEVIDWNTLPSGTPYMVLEFLDGEDLRARIRRGPLPLPSALHIARQIGSALDASHRADVVHRDLKPENIFLCPSDVDGELGDRVKVLDFGISKIHGSQTVKTQDSVLLGTPQYMSPEQAMGKNQEIDHRTDQFALASIVYEMLAGRPPFTGENLVSVMYRVVHEDPIPLEQVAPDVPPNVVAAVARAMAKDPAARFADVAAFVAALTGRPLQRIKSAGERPSPPVNTSPSREGEAFAATAATPATVLGKPARAPTPFEGAATEGNGTLRPVVSAAATPSPSTGKSSRAGWLVGGVVALGVAGALFAAGYARAPSKTSTPLSAGPTLVSPTVQIAAVPDLGVQGTAVVAPAGPAAHAHVHASSDAPVAAAPVERAEVRNDLDAAERALASGDANSAIHLAQRAYNKQHVERAFSIITRAYCRAGDLGNAKAAFHSVKGDRARVVRACKQLDIDL